MIDISVVIPTYNRATALVRCLRGVLDQTLARTRYEILVADDGSTDETRSVLQQLDGVRTFFQARNMGPAAARNVAVAAAQGTYIVFLDDDVVPGPTVLAQHVAAHAEAAGDHIAILGNSVWPPETPMSPFTRYLYSDHEGGRLVYCRIPDPQDVSYHWFITCHVSVARTFLMQHGLFDEDFPYAYGEDTELAYRLQQQGMRIVYRPDIVVHHHHAESYVQSKQIRRRAGQVARLMAHKHPELADLTFLSLSAKGQLTTWIKRRGTEILLDPLLDWADRRELDHPWLARAYRWALQGHQMWALQDATRRTGAGGGSARVTNHTAAPSRSP